MLNETDHAIVDQGVLERRRHRLRARRGAPPITLPAIPATQRIVETSAGPVRVRETGEGPTLLFVHGLLVDGRVFDPLVEELRGRFRCVLPDLPLGSHRLPLAAGADRSPEGVAALLDELVETLGLADVTVVANDSGGAITQLWMDAGMSDRVSRVVLTPCDCFERFLPPGFSAFQVLARIPGIVGPILAATRLRAVRRLPVVYGGLTHRRIDDAVLVEWLRSAREVPGVAHDAVAFLQAISAQRLIAAEARLGGFDRPVLLPWAPEQGWFPARHARRLAAILPDARIVPIAGTGAFVSLEQPAALAAAIAPFAGEADGDGTLRAVAGATRERRAA